MIELRMKGWPPALWASALIAASPLAFAAYERLVHGALLSPIMLLACGLVACLPWLSRAIGRATYRAAVDDLALHVGDEALVFTTITEVREHRTWRRAKLVLRRGRVLRVELVTRDAFAGHLEPLDELMKRLPTATSSEAG